MFEISLPRSPSPPDHLVWFDTMIFTVVLESGYIYLFFGRIFEAVLKNELTSIKFIFDYWEVCKGRLDNTIARLYILIGGKKNGLDSSLIFNVYLFAQLLVNGYFV